MEPVSPITYTESITAEDGDRNIALGRILTYDFQWRAGTLLGTRTAPVEVGSVNV